MLGDWGGTGGIWCYELLYAPPNSYVEALAPHVTVPGDGAFKEVTKVK